MTQSSPEKFEHPVRCQSLFQLKKRQSNPSKLRDPKIGERAEVGKSSTLTRKKRVKQEHEIERMSSTLRRIGFKKERKDQQAELP